MSRLRGLVLAGGAGLALAACNMAPGYFFPQHAMIGGGPAGYTEGVVQVRGGCFYLGADTLLIWPVGYSMRLTDDGVAVTGDGFAVRAGDRIGVGGGEYTTNQLPDVAASARAVPCPGPYWLVTEIVSVGN